MLIDFDRLTPTGPQVLEFNCRFGDPETQVVLPLLETDLYEVLTACCTGALDTVDVRFKDNVSAATVVCAAKGYPETYPKGMTITGLEETSLLENVKVYHAGTVVDEQGVTRCSGGRVLAVTGIGRSLNDALVSAYRGVSKIAFAGPNNEPLMHFRTDIAKRAIDKKLRIGVLGSTRGTSLVPVIDACASGQLHAEIVAILSNKSSAPILDKGRALGVSVTTAFISAKGLSREQYDAECTATLVDAGVEFVLLVGYMRILSKPFTDFWNGRCINVHPSLLPKHAGGMDLAVSAINASACFESLHIQSFPSSHTGPSSSDRCR
jgi:phosphoribosylamine--glycine ligase/phosphoribosylglycinamide formyltransferase/phosphoribosylformylglycinamidine cyclo-ligase/phosphoribosylamine--glycine ligase/phosphoribosylformylglycinamidine cyclo-ligase